MLQLVAILAPLLGIAAAIGFIWLVVCAFRESVLWGVLVLVLSPVTAIIFAIKYWENSKKPFLIYAGGSAGSIMLVVFSMVAIGTMAAQEMARAVGPDGTIAFQPGQPDGAVPGGDPTGIRGDADAIAARVLGDVEPAAGAEPEATQPDPQIEVKDANTEIDTILSAINTRAIAKGYVEIPFHEASRYIGERAKVVEHDDHEVKGRIKEASSDRLVLRRRLTSGDMSVEIRRRDIKSLRILRE